MTAIQGSYRADIDGLRAVAIISVVGFHAAPGTVRGGFVGVDVFFVISGFLISTIIFFALERGTFSFLGFYRRRVRRIFPALIIVLLTCLVFGWFVMLAPEYEKLGKATVASAAFLANFVFWSQSGYFDTDALTKPLLHLWSLGIEEQFYIVWPIVLWFTWRRRGTPLLIALGLGAVSFAINIYLVGGNTASAFYLPQARAWELMIGSLLAYISLYHPGLLPEKRRMRDAASIAGMSLILAGIILAKEQNFPGWWVLFPTAGTALTIAAGPSALLNRLLLQNPVMVWFGLISYPLYLWHWPLLSFAAIVNGEKAPAVWRICLVILSVALAWATYILVEKPIRFGPLARKAVPALCAAMAVMALCGFTAYWSAGFPLRNEKLNADAAELEWDWYFRLIGDKTADCLPVTIREKSHRDAGGTIRCRQTIAGDSNPTIALIGDSHAEHLFWGLVQTLPRDRNLVYYTWSCLPFLGLKRLETSECEDMDEALRYIIAKPSIRTVILSDDWDGRAFEDDFRAASGKPGDASDLFKDRMRDTLARLAAAHKDVVFVQNNPDLGFNPLRCVRPFMSGLLKATCFMSMSDLDKQRAPYMSVSKPVIDQFPNVRVVDPASVLCMNGRCPISLDGKLLYHDDGHHLTTFGSIFLARSLLAKSVLGAD